MVGKYRIYSPISRIFGSKILVQKSMSDLLASHREISIFLVGKIINGTKFENNYYNYQDRRSEKISLDIEK